MVAAGGIFLKMQYEIFMQGQSAGTATVEKEGLYFTFTCICYLQTRGIYRVSVSQGDHSENLGVLLPSGSVYKLTTKIPQNRFSAEEFTFQIMDTQKKASGTFVPLVSGQPYFHISALRRSCLKKLDGQIFIYLMDEQNHRFSSKPTGQ